jgi:hypothetical protein
VKRRCEWLLCVKAPTRQCVCWGEVFDLCEEHGDLVGDDGSLNELVPMS